MKCSKCKKELGIWDPKFQGITGAFYCGTCMTKARKENPLSW